jgi:SAM-dependent methyltransferase
MTTASPVAAPPAAGPLTLTGERTLPGIEEENYWFRRHEAAYEAVLPWITGADVIEAGAGEGYGAALLAGPARRVFALDYDASAAAHAARTYPRISVARANLAALPVRSGIADAVVNLQVIEHLWDQPQFIAECARVLRPGGTLIVTTPNRLTFSPGQDTPQNPFHTRELDAGELTELLDPQFKVVRMYGVHHGPRLTRMDRNFGGITAVQLATPPAEWSRGLRRAVASVRTSDFTITEDRIGESLDLFAVAIKR